MAKLKIIYTDGDDVKEKEVQVTKLTVTDFSRDGYALVQTICRILKSEGKL